MIRWSLGTILGDDRHGRAADVAGAHAADLHVPVVAHGCFEEIWSTTNRLWREMMSGDAMHQRHQRTAVSVVRPSTVEYVIAEI